MRGINAVTGKHSEGIDHLRQSIADILRTPIGSRVMRRDYGSRLFELVDAPMNSRTIAGIYSAIADALNKWEPRFKLSSSQVDTRTTPGRIVVSLTGTYEEKTVTINAVTV
jgi:uncharacterized protein